MSGDRYLAAHANDVHDCSCTARTHSLDQRVHDIDVREELRLNGIVPRFRLELREGHAARGASAIDQDIDGSASMLGLIDNTLRGGRITQIGAEPEGPFWIHLQADARLLDTLRITPDETDGAALANELARAGKSDPARATSDEDMLALQLEVHFFSMPSVAIDVKA